MRLVLLKRGSRHPLYLTLLSQDLRLFALYEKVRQREGEIEGEENLSGVQPDSICSVFGFSDSLVSSAFGEDPEVARVASFNAAAPAGLPGARSWIGAGGRGPRGSVGQQRW